MKKKGTKNKVKNKNSNRVNIINTIKIGNTKKRSYRKKSGDKSGVSSIVVSVPQNFPQPFYIPTSNPSYPFQLQPPVSSPVQNPTKIMKDEMDRELVSANSQYIKSKPTFTTPSNNTRPKIVTGLKIDDIKPIYSSDTEYFSAVPIAKPRNVFFTDVVDSDSEIQQLSLNQPSAQKEVSINRMNQNQLHRLAQQKGIDLIDPVTKKKRNMTKLKELLKDNYIR